MFISKKKEDKKYTAAVIVIGNEILSGKTKDLNLNFLAKELSNLGVELLESRIILDDKNSIVRSLNELRKKYTYVFVTGGLGPTHDDITTLSVSKAFKVELYRDQDALSMIKKYYHEANNRDLTETAFKMADVPVGCTLILNDVSGAPGFKIKNVFVFAGVPKVMQAMFNYAKLYIKSSNKFILKSIHVEAGESAISYLLGKLQKKYNDLILGSYPETYKGKWCSNLTVRGKNLSRITQLIKELEKKLAKDKIKCSVKGSKT